MNKKGFAISVILYVVVFLIIAILYILLGIVKSRYNVNSDLKDNVVQSLNGIEHIYDKSYNDVPLNLLIVDLNEGKATVGNSVVTDSIEVVRYAGSEYVMPVPTRDPLQVNVATYTLSYDTDGGLPIPTNPDPVTITSTTTYSFGGWVPSTNCGSLNGSTYIFPPTFSTRCTMTAIWNNSTPAYSSSLVTLAPAVEKNGYQFAGWESSVNGQIYDGGGSYNLNANTTMIAKWVLNS